MHLEQPKRTAGNPQELRYFSELGEKVVILPNRAKGPLINLFADATWA